MTSGRNTKGDSYIEFPMSTEKQDEKIRVTLVKTPRWLKGPTIRIQKRDAKGLLFKGPEFPANQAINLVAAISELVTGR